LTHLQNITRLLVYTQNMTRLHDYWHASLHA